MLKNAYFLAKIGADTTENDRIFAKKLAITLPSLPGPRRGGDRRGGAGRRRELPHAGATLSPASSFV